MLNKIVSCKNSEKLCHMPFGIRKIKRGSFISRNFEFVISEPTDFFSISKICAASFEAFHFARQYHQR